MEAKGDGRADPDAKGDADVKGDQDAKGEGKSGEMEERSQEEELQRHAELQALASRDSSLPRRIRRIKSPFIKRVAIFCDSDNLVAELEAFCIQHCGSFTDKDEHSLENTETHRSYTQLIEHKLELFMEKEGVSEKDFYRHCLEAQDGQDDPAADTFVQMLLGAVEFQHFAVLMQQLRVAHEPAHK
jgi:hypothetical protein